MAVKVGINGFGRIGRLAFRLMSDDPAFNIVAINDLSNPADLAYLLKYDTTHGGYKQDAISSTEDSVIVDGKKYRIYAEKDATNIPWGELGVDVVIEATGFYASKEKSMAHIKAGAKSVIITAPAGHDLKTIVYNVNHKTLAADDQIISGASCTTNCLAPIAKVMSDTFGIENGFMTTVHAYTNDQATLDIVHRKGYMSRRGRAAAANIIPAETGAARAIGDVLPELKGRLDGMALRVPVPDGSVVDLVFVPKKQAKDAAEVNAALKAAVSETLGYTDDPIVSGDVVSQVATFGSLVDGLSTKVQTTPDGKQLIKVISWYDNEMSYTSQLVRTAKYFAELIQK